MKRYLTLSMLWLGISAYAVASSGDTPPALAQNPASFFLGGCGLILVMMLRLSWKIRKTGK